MYTSFSVRVVEHADLLALLLITKQAKACSTSAISAHNRKTQEQSAFQAQLLTNMQ